jgi:hypothetical protein
MKVCVFEEAIVTWMKGRGWVSRGAIRTGLSAGFSLNGADRIGPAVNSLVRQGVLVQEWRNHVYRVCLAGEKDSVPDFSPWSVGGFGARPEAPSKPDPRDAVVEADGG